MWPKNLLQKKTEAKNNDNAHASMNWYSMDLHIHTPASSDYQNPEASYLDILRRAEARDLDIIALTDHNTVAGCRAMEAEMEQLRLLRSLKRILPEEEQRLQEFERLLSKTLVLPGFEFTATFGFHILGVFPPDKSLRELEYILLDLNVPANQLEEGSVTVGASADVLTAYHAIHEAGGLAIAAHANSSNGVAMRGIKFGGQTKIAYTQDPHLHALEITDLEKRGRFSTAAFFSGSKPEYPRRMHCIQGSDAHRLDNDPVRRANLGIGGRVTEVLLPERSFAALKELFEGNDFARTRPRVGKRQAKDKEPAFDFVQAAREEGSNIVQQFHESLRGARLNDVIADVCAFANTNGGSLFIGVSDDPRRPVAGVRVAGMAVRRLEKEISQRISPELHCTVDVHKSGGKDIIRILVPRGDERPYAIDDNKIYIRSEAETGLAVRDEIVRLIAKQAEPEAPPPPAREERGRRKAGRNGAAKPPAARSKPAAAKPARPRPEAPPVAEDAPRTGVEVVSMEPRDGASYYVVRDLRNGMVVNNVTEKSARKLWHYAIKAYAELQPTPTADWRGDFGLLKAHTQYKQRRFDLVQRVGGDLRYYFGVTEDGIHGPWTQFVPQDGPAPEEAES